MSSAACRDADRLAADKWVAADDVTGEQAAQAGPQRMCSYPAALWVAAHHAARCAGQHGAALAAAAEAAARRASKCPALHSDGRKGQAGGRHHDNVTACRDRADGAQLAAAQH